MSKVDELRAELAGNYLLTNMAANAALGARRLDALIEAARQEARDEERALLVSLLETEATKYLAAAHGRRAVYDKQGDALYGQAAFVCQSMALKFRPSLNHAAPPPSEPAKRVATAFACPSCQSLNAAVDEDCLCVGCGGEATPIDNDGRVLFDQGEPKDGVK